MKKIPYISNSINLKEKENYCAILGLNPSQGARSPVLWNACFKKFNMPFHFYPFDVDDQNLESLIEFLRNDKNFYGGAIAVPHKESIIEFLDFVENEAKLIGAVNLIYKNEKGLCGSNTDGLGAIHSYAEELSQTVDTFAKGKSALIIGTGGAAKAVSVYMAKSLGKSGKLILLGRNINKLKALSEKCSTFCKVSIINNDQIKNHIDKIDFLINATSIGFKNIIKDNEKSFYLEPFTPLADVPKDGFTGESEEKKISWLKKNISILNLNFSQSSSLLSKANEKVIVIDVIYQPIETQFLKMAGWYGFKTLTGLKMNLLQAVFGYQRAMGMKSDDLSSIIKVMKRVK